MKKIYKKEISIGVATILSILFLYLGISFLKGVNLLTPSNSYMVEYENVTGLAVSGPVTIEGFKVGMIRSIDYDYAGNGVIRVQLSLDNELKIPTGSKASIIPNMLGDASIELRLNKYVSTYYKPGELLEGETGSDLMSELQNTTLPAFNKMLPKLDSILASVNAVLGQPELAVAVGRLDKITKNIEASTDNLNKVMASDLPQLAKNANQAMANINSLTGQLSSIDFKTTINSFDTSLVNINEATAKLNSKENSLGLLLNDKSMYTSLLSTVNSADSLLIDIKKQPKRYIHFSVFGKK